MTKPIIIPKAVQVCLGAGVRPFSINQNQWKSGNTHHIITNAPRMAGGAPTIKMSHDAVIWSESHLHSAAYTGTVELFGPIPKPRTKRATNRWGHEFVTPCQMHVRKEKRAVIKMVPLLPNSLLSYEQG